MIPEADGSTRHGNATTTRTLTASGESGTN
jgi:hypothetical protein